MSLLVAGGCKESKERGVLNSTEIVSINIDSKGNSVVNCKFGPSLLTPRRGAALQTVGGKLFIIGGCGPGQEALKSVEVLHDNQWNPENIWLATGRSCFASCSANSILTVFGGWDGQECLNSVETIPAGVCQNLPTLLKNSSAVYYEDKVFLFGGWDGKRTLKTVFSYNPETQETDLAALLPFPIECHSTAVFGNQVLISGGFDGQTVRNSILLFNLETLESVVLEQQLAQARENHVSAIFDKYYVVLAGWDGVKALDTIEIYEFGQIGPFLRKFYHNGRLNEARNKACVCVT